MAVSAVHFLALLLIIGAGLRTVEAMLAEHYPDSPVLRALTFAY